MIRDVLEMAARLEEIKAAIRQALPQDAAEAVIVEAGRRSIYTPMRADDALLDTFRAALSERLKASRQQNPPSDPAAGDLPGHLEAT